MRINGYGEGANFNGNATDLLKLEKHLQQALYITDAFLSIHYLLSRQSVRKQADKLNY